MQRAIFQAEPDLLARARRRAQQRGVSFAAVVREALRRELGADSPPPPLSSVGVVESASGDLSERASRDEYEPDPSRS